MYENYCRLRDSRGLKDADVVKGTGITKSTFSDWKHGRSAPKQPKLQKIADFFGITLDYLMNGKETEPITRDDGDITKEINKILSEINNDKKEICYKGVPIDDRQAAILRNALEIAFENLEIKKKEQE